MNASRPTILHLASDAGGGGSVAALRSLVERLPHGDWRTVVVTQNWGETGGLDLVADDCVELPGASLLRIARVSELRRILQRERPGVVQTWSPAADLVGGLAARRAGVRNVIWRVRQAGSFPHGVRLPVLLRLAHRLAARFLPRRIVFDSMAELQRRRCRGAAAAWIPDGVCTQRFAPDPDAGARLRESLCIPHAVPVVGWCGPFNRLKNLPVFLHAAAMLQQWLPETRFILCGGAEADLEPSARIALAQAPNPGRFHFMPPADRREQIYPAFDVLALCSESEALPAVLLEALSCGVPCVATNVGDCAEAIGEAGAVVDPGDPIAAAVEWRRLLTLDSARKFNLSRSARERIAGCFSLDQTTAAFGAIYEDLLREMPATG